MHTLGLQMFKYLSTTKSLAFDVSYNVYTVEMESTASQVFSLVTIVTYLASKELRIPGGLTLWELL